MKQRSTDSTSARHGAGNRTAGTSLELRGRSLLPLGAALMAGGFSLVAQGAEPATKDDVQRGKVLPEVSVEGQAPPPYKAEVLSSPKRPQAIQDIPQTVQVLTEEMLEIQGTKTLRDALRNVTGISFQAGEGNPPSGDQLKIRGFSARDDILVDGVRDTGVFFRDPFNVETIEVTKGPASAFAGRGSSGGTINQVSKAPSLKQKREIEAGIGTDSLYRITADINQPLESIRGAFRLNLMSHQNDQPGRDEVENKRFGIAPSIAFGLGTPTRFTLSYMYMRQDNRPDSGLPNSRNASLQNSGFGGKVAPVNFSNYYGHSTDYQDLETHQATFRFEHDFNDKVSVRNQLRYGHTSNDSIFSSPRFSPGGLTTLNANTLVVGNQKPRDQDNELLINQTDLTFKFMTGAIRHHLVTGLELSREDSENKRRLDANGPATNLLDPQLRAAAPIAYNGTRARLDLETTALYVSDIITLTPQWDINAGLRWDRVKTKVRALNDGRVPGYSQDLSRTDTEVSGNVGLIFRPIPTLSLYAGYGSSFDPSGRAEIVQLAGGNNNLPVTAADFNLKPERTRSYEVGAKWNALGESLLIHGALFRTERFNGRTRGPADIATVLNGVQEVQGIELSATGRVTSRLNLFAGYTFQDSEVKKSNDAVQLGQELDNTPRHTFNAWATYQLTNELSVGGGVQYVDTRNNIIASSASTDLVVVVDNYWLFDAVALYQVSKDLKLRLNVYNLMDEKYLFEVAGGQSIPGAGRAAVLSAIHSF